MKDNRKIKWGLIGATLFCLLLAGVVYATVFSDTYDTATPAGSDDPAEADDRMREIKSAVQERENVDHYWPLTGTEVSDADTGEHRKILFHAPIAATPTVAADHLDIRAKDVGGKAELAITDEDENELILTSKGNNLANDTHLTATDNAGTGSVNLIKATTGDIPEVLVGAVLSADTAPAVDAGIANKKYVDDQITANATDPQALVKGWVNFAGASGTINDSFNVTGVAKNSTGNYTVTWDTNFANNKYAVSVAVPETGAQITVGNVTSLAVGSCVIKTRNFSAVQNPTFVLVMAVGDQ